MSIGNKTNKLYANMDVSITVTNLLARCDRRLAHYEAAVAPNFYTCVAYLYGFGCKSSCRCCSNGVCAILQMNSFWSLRTEGVKSVWMVDARGFRYLALGIKAKGFRFREIWIYTVASCSYVLWNKTEWRRHTLLPATLHFILQFKHLWKRI